MILFDFNKKKLNLCFLLNIIILEKNIIKGDNPVNFFFII